MQLFFTKMHGLGNDFVVLDGVNQTIQLSSDQVKSIADRHFGVGCDQLLVVENSQLADADFRYRIFNSDGAEVEHCGNGARCFVRFVHDKGLTDKSEIRVEIPNGIISIRLEKDGQVTVNMGPPEWIPMNIPLQAKQRQTRYEIQDDGQLIEFGAVSMGNPHAVVLVEDIKQAAVEQIGTLLGSNPVFPNGVNVGFMQVVDKKHIKLRVYERGAGETLACGTGACAAVAIGQYWDLLGERVNVELLGGQLCIQWAGEQQAVYMTGPAETVFEGRMSI